MLPLQVASESPFSPFHGLQTVSEDPFSPFHGLQTVCEGSFPLFHGLQTVCEGSFPLFHALQTVCEDPFPPFHAVQTLCEGSFPPFHALQTVCEGSFSLFHAMQSLSRGVRFLLAPLARLLQEVFLPIHQGYLPLETSFSLLFFTPTIAIPHPLSRENHPKIQKKPPFCSSLAILTAKIPPFPQLERKEGWQLRRCPKGKNKKADLKKGESYTSLGGSSGFMLVDWKGAPPAKIKTTARSPVLLSRPHSSSQSENPSLYQRHNGKPDSQQAVRFGKCLRIGVLHSVQLYSLLEILVARGQKG